MSSPVEFPFPSTGKVYSKADTHARSIGNTSGFHSLQTGKCIQRTELNGDNGEMTEVSIPFQRESVFKVTCSTWTGVTNLVSIPFKRESVFKDARIEDDSTGGLYFLFPFPSNGKVYSKLIRALTTFGNNMSFHSLPPGKCIQSLQHTDDVHEVAICAGFHSLPPGKCIQRAII